MEGWRMALDSGAAIVVQIDAGGSHDPVDAGKLMAYIGNPKFGDGDMVIGSRFCPGARYIGNRKRALLSRLAAHMCNVRQVQPRFTDWTSGYRAFNRHALEHLLDFGIYRTTMHSWQIETLRNAIDLDLHIVEVPITYHAGRSSFNRRIAKDALRVWATI
jgi:dolichol-phosphate mannosyltransferase